MTNESVKIGHQGEILVKSGTVTPGYLNNPKANQETFDDEGFFKTGDCGYFDNSGKLFIVDRYKEIIKSEGCVVCPAEIESILRSHPSVLDAVVFGVSHPTFTEVPVALVVKKDGCLVSESELMDHVNCQVASWKQLRGGVKFLDQLPLLPFGKVDRKQLKQGLRSQFA